MQVLIHVYQSVTIIAAHLISLAIFQYCSISEAEFADCLLFRTHFSLRFHKPSPGLIAQRFRCH